jgi:NitT/TauT family transport system permease protein
MRILVRAMWPFVAVTAFWWLIYATADLPVQLLPSPLSVAEALVFQFVSTQFWIDLGVSAGRVSVGFVLSVVLAMPVGLAMTWSARFRDSYTPFNNYIRYLPVAALVPLMILWLGIGFQNKVAIIFIGTFFQLTIMLHDNFRQVPQGYLESARWIGARSSWVLLWRVILPYRLPYVLDDLKVAFGWAWSYLLVAEIVAANSGIGFKIIQAQRFLQTQDMLALIFVVGGIGLAFDWGFDWINRSAFHWRSLEDHQ